MSTWMSFSSISTSATPLTRGGWAARASTAALARPALGGRLSPAPRRGAWLSVERLVGGAWQIVARDVRVGSGGSYHVRLALPGRYRVVYRGLDGPAVNVG
jgi:hypothetical protein